MSKRSKIVLNVLSVLTILLILSSCKTSPEWTWKADFWAADHVAQDIMNKDEKVVKCFEPAFDEYACLTYDSIEELEFNIEKMRKRHNSLFKFWKLSLTEAIEKRKDKGEDASDLEAALEISKQKFKLIDTIKVR